MRSIAPVAVLGLCVVAQIALAEASPQEAEGTYGPTTRDDTLWSVANAVRPSGATVADTIEALQRMNPCAFVNSDPDLLVRGVILKIPTTAAMVTSSVEDSPVPQPVEDIPAAAIDDGREVLARRNAELEERLQAADDELADATAASTTLTEELAALRARLDESDGQAAAARALAAKRAGKTLWVALAGIAAVFLLLLVIALLLARGQREQRTQLLLSTTREVSDKYAPDIKLNLARAFMDMGRTEQAREVLEEVLAEGSEEERSEAEELLGRLE